MLYAQSSLFHISQINNWNDLGLETQIIFNDIVSLDMLMAYFLKSNSELNFSDLPIEITRDQIRFGKLSDRHYADCMIIKNKSHLKDYYHFTLTAKATHHSTLITIYRTGQSVLLENNNSKKIGKAKINTFKNDTNNNEDIETEKTYYISVIKALKTLLN